MPPRKKAAAGPPALTDGDVADLRARLTGGDKPRVVVRTASAAVPAGTRGNVVRIGNPSDGEFIVVRLGRDEVPFAPSELAVGGRGGRPAKVAPPPPAPARPAKK
ncbi:MAG: hypothetical protein QOC82_2258, partial [Frankiaceae bacterium]|nr:hypothetical protein [Frankiaceae bacterium]